MKTVLLVIFIFSLILTVSCSCGTGPQKTAEEIAAEEQAKADAAEQAAAEEEQNELNQVDPGNSGLACDCNGTDPNCTSCGGDGDLHHADSGYLDRR